MIVCHCRIVNDRTILELLRSGEDTPNRIERHCGAGGACGGCAETIERLIDQHRATAAS